MIILAYIAAAIGIFYLGYKFGGVAISDIKKEVDAISATASADAKALAAKIKSLL